MNHLITNLTTVFNETTSIMYWASETVQDDDIEPLKVYHYRFQYMILCRRGLLADAFPTRYFPTPVSSLARA